MLEYKNGKITITNKALQLLSEFLNSRVGLAVCIAVIFGTFIWPEIRGMREDVQKLVVSANRAESQLSFYNSIPEKLAEIRALILSYATKR